MALSHVASVRPSRSVLDTLAGKKPRKPRPQDRYTYVEPKLLVSFTVEGEPVAKARPRLAPRGGTYTPEKTRRGEAHVQECCFVANPRLRPVSGLMCLKVRFHHAGLGRSDLDNCIKLVSDALNMVAWFDDAQVTKLDAELFMFDAQPRTEVEVWLIATPG